jgi:histidinol-phosphatase (PHP family)
VKAAQDVLSSCDFDFILGSLHNLAGMEDFYFLNYDDQNVNELLSRYFDEMLEMVRWNGFDSLAHLTYPYRYIVGDHGIPAQLYPDYGERVDEILRLLAQNHKALELNTSGLRQKLGQTLPPIEVLRRFRQMGGEYVTIGSDAHRWGDIGSGVETGLALLSQAGFDRFTIYVGREPVLLPIE